MLPKQVIYIIEAYKYEACLVFALVIITLMLPLLHALQSNSTSHNFISGEVNYGAVLSHTVVDPGRKIEQKPLPSAAVTASPYSSVDVRWPMPGRVTTEFGVPHRPWQKTHSGIDITSAARAGITPVTAFKEGTISSVITSSRGLGNHIVIDHGNGLKSVYAHLSYFSARQGQHVYAGEPIGFEGRSGATTGTHLHFEILVNDKFVNPRKFIAGNP